VRYRGLLLVVPAACLGALAPAATSAASGATLTVPSQVQAGPGASPVVGPSFSYPEATPFCTVGVVFTWDGANWLSELPTKNGSLCVAAGVSAPAPSGHGAAGAHQVCGSAGAQLRDCKTVTVVAVANATPTPSSAAAPGIGAPVPSASAAVSLPRVTPAVQPPTPVVQPLTSAVSHLPAHSTAGLVLLAVGIAGLLAIGMRRVLLLLRRRRATPLPSPDQRR
jgi:hypothetical protein